ncbi:cytochrome c [Salinimicrobium catena]|uniref:c-type cytochrome n=1 Tax=Salinimicrobium catena TaxID=390640 RepID=UPI002FE4CE04
MLLFLAITIGCKNSSEKETGAAMAQTEMSEELQESISRGAAIYNNFCASCHLSNGEGITGVFPPLKGSDWFTEQRKKTISAVKNGINGPIEVNGEEYDNLMPSLGLTDKETADVLNYIFNSWGNKVEEPVTPEEVAAIEK